MLSKCPKCGNSFFKVEENSPQDSNYKFIFVQCSSCNSVVGVMEYFNVGEKISNLEKKINKIDNSLDTINNNIAVLDNNIRRLH